MAFATTPSQTIGPFFSILLPLGSNQLVEAGSEGAVTIQGFVLDGDGAPVGDALVEIWQAGPDGFYNHPADYRRHEGAGFIGYGRCLTAADGGFSFTTIQPGSVPGFDERMQAPHISVGIFARGLLKRLATRIYFPGEASRECGRSRYSTPSTKLVGRPSSPNPRVMAAFASISASVASKRPCSLTSDSFLGGMFTSPEIEEATSERAWLQAMLDVEAALARANGAAGFIPSDAVTTIVAACDAGQYDASSMRAGAIASATPVVPLVEAVRVHVGPVAAPFVHHGATSQDIVDSAMMLIARRALSVILADLDRAASCLVALAREHRETPMLARTLLQPALPITFGLKCANWLDALLDGRDGLVTVRDERLAAQFGGPAGTLASLGTDGPRVAELLAADLGLCAPPIPWHTNRSRIIDLATALAVTAGASGKIAGDALLLAQAEVGEVTAGSGPSSSMPHKRNPAAAVLTSAAAKHATGYAAMLLGLQVHEYERAAGTWQAEWQPMTLLLRATGGAVHNLATLVDQLEPHPAAMLRNLRAAGVPGSDRLDNMGSVTVFIDRALARYEVTA